jgi:hypothetical protein
MPPLYYNPFRKEGEIPKINNRFIKAAFYK